MGCFIMPNKNKKSKSIVHALRDAQLTGNTEELKELVRVIDGIHAEQGGLLPPITQMGVVDHDIARREARRIAREEMKRQRAEERNANPRPPRRPRFGD